MAAIKLVILLGVAVLYTCGQVPELRAANPSLKKLEIGPEEILEEIEELVESAINSSISEIGELWSELHDTVETILDTVTSSLNSTYVSVIEEYEALEAEAKEQGVDISSCSGHFVSDIETLRLTIQSNITVCIEAKAMEGYEYINETVSDIQAVYATITSVGDELTACSEESTAGALLCYAELYLKMSEYITTLPAEISTLLAKGEGYLTALILDIELCSSTNLLKSFDTEAYAMLANVTECAEALMNKTSIYQDLS